jgi:Animal haem peroxidase
MSRRRALSWIGASLAAAVLGRFPALASAAPAPGEASAVAHSQHGAMPRGLLLPTKNRSLEGRFGLMFKKLPAFEPPDKLLTKLAGAMNEDPPAPSRLPNLKLPSGFVFLGQFIDHDLTFDDTSLSLQREDPNALINFRAARFELDSVYGAGPSKEESGFYDPDDPAKLHIDGADLPRRADGTAIIGDPRDDENLVTSQLHLAFRKFHNKLVDYVRDEQGLSNLDQVFREAQRLCRWHYQWMVLHDFLPRIVGHDVVDSILQERDNAPAKVKLDFYKPKNPKKPMMPVEFAVAAYRFGHSMLRSGYVINEQGKGAVLFGNTPTDSNLNGRRPIPANLVIFWPHFFEIPDKTSTPENSARPIDGHLSGPLFDLPETIVPKPKPEDPPSVPHVTSLAKRNLLRGKMLGLASGQRVAQEMGEEVLSNAQLNERDPQIGNDPGWGGQAPLWFYILKEAELQHGGKQLGAVGGRIVAEVFVGLLERDKNSYLRVDPAFRPEPLVAGESGEFGMGDLLKFAGVA